MRNKKHSLQLKNLFWAMFAIFSMLVPVSTVSAEEPDTSEEEWGFSAILYDNSNGLPASEANAIAQTRNNAGNGIY